MSVTLVIGDLHCPAEHYKALDFAESIKKLYKPDNTVFIGDIVDNHTLSRFTKDQNAPLGSHELDLAVSNLQLWYEVFPKAYVTLGNHDNNRIVQRANDAGLSSRFIKNFSDIIEAPEGWKFVDDVIIDNVKYFHGVGYNKSNWKDLARNNNMSCLIGHLHSIAGFEWYANQQILMFSGVVGCLVDKDHKYMAYAKYMRDKPILGVTVVIDGRMPVFYPMDL